MEAAKKMAKYLGPYSTQKSPVKDLHTLVQEIASQKWEESERAALSRAEQTGQSVLAAFTGIPWCYPCMKLEQEVFQTWTFLNWAFGKVVLWSINDDGQGATPPEFAKYGVQPVPSILGIDAQGTELGRVVGYLSGTGAQSWIDSFESEMGW
jgi:thiol:disulfide interchange protein